MKLQATTKEAYQLLLDGSIALARMEENGLRVDVGYLDWAIRDTSNRITKLETSLKEDEVYGKWRKRYGDKTNFGSRPQLGTVLSEAGFELDGQTRTKRISTRESELEKIDHPFVKRYIRLEKLKKVKSTFLEGLRREVVGDRVHPFFNLHTVDTIRSSSNSVNIQNQTNRDKRTSEILRKCYIPDPGHVIVEVDFCVPETTLIETIDGKQTIKDIINRLNKSEDVYVYGYDESKNRVGVSRVLRGALTKKKAKVLKVTLDNGETVIATPNHNFILRDGTTVRLADIRPGMSLMPFYKKTWVSSYKTCYHKIYLNNGLSTMAHNLIALDALGIDIQKEKKVVHHWNHNGCDNSLSNLEVMTRARHMQIHAKESWKDPTKQTKRLAWSRSKEHKERLSKINKERAANLTEEEREEMRERGRESHRRRKGCVAGEKNPMYGRKHSEATKKRWSLLRKGKKTGRPAWSRGLTKHTSESLRKLSESLKGKIPWHAGLKGVIVAWNKGKKGGRLSEETKRKIGLASKGHYVSDSTKAAQRAYMLGWWKNINKSEICSICGKEFVFLPGHMPTHKLSYKEYKKTYNHKVVAVESAGCCDVYNISVDKIHSYALGAGIIVKNCALEFRIAACKWKDPVMLKYIEEGRDAHYDVTSDCYKVPVSEVSKPMRSVGKNQFTFPILYGSYYRKCAINLWQDMERLELKTVGDKLVKEVLAEQGITSLGRCHPRERPIPGTFEYHVKLVEDTFNARFTGFRDGKDPWYNAYLKRGGFRMMTGFWLEGIFSKNKVLNTDVQGPAFHIVLWGIIQLQKWIDKVKSGAKIIAEIHDSILGSIPVNEVQDYINEARRILTVDVRKYWDWIIAPLGVEVEVSDSNWFDKKPWIERNGIWGPKVA